MNHATLFSGIGGAEIASQRLGWNNIFSCEWEDFPRKVLQYHYPNTDHYGDIREFNAEKYRGQIDVLTGGFPCQPFSNAGSRKGAEDERYLWKEMLRIIKECKPTWIIGENVAGIITMGVKGAPFEVGSQANLFEQDNTIYQRTDIGILASICNDLEREGYEVQTLVIPAEAVQAPHRRDRVFIIAYSEQKRLERQDKTGQKNIKKRSDQTIRRTVARCSTKDYATNSNGSRLKRKRECTKPTTQGGACNSCNSWHDFPTQPPICSGDDGLSSRLDSITFSKWRAESIKAFGNAIVPEVIYRIYEGIDALNKKQKQ